jgi:hypothetical protein
MTELPQLQQALGDAARRRPWARRMRPALAIGAALAVCVLGVSAATRLSLVGDPGNDEVPALPAPGAGLPSQRGAEPPDCQRPPPTTTDRPPPGALLERFGVLRRPAGPDDMPTTESLARAGMAGLRGLNLSA